MKIAIAAPCPVPYMVGGAEKLWWGLAAHLNAHTAHQAELIKLPSPEHDLPSLLRSYQTWSTLDLGTFDVVISGKYPAWIVRHPRHVCYMLHRLRGLYDWYAAAPTLPAEVAAYPRVASLRAYMSRTWGERGALGEFFERWNEILCDGGRPAATTQFPGPLARELVHWLDAIALAPEAIVRYAAISATVANRPGYFPEGAQVAVAHPPPHRAMAPGERADYFYTLSRLDGPKRVGLIVEAMGRVRTELELVVGGTGPEEGRIREIARDDPRVRFVGFESDAQVLERYRGSLAVPFVPSQEDYGLIAVEAMQCAKPVITTHDSGGVCELVVPEESGIVCEPDPQSLAAAMQRLADDRELARAMGRRGLELGVRVTWTAVERALLDGIEAAAPRKRARHKLLVATPFAVDPPRAASHVRVRHLAAALGPEIETVIVSATPAGGAFDGAIAPGVREVRVPPGAFAEALGREARDADAVLAWGPAMLAAASGLGLPLWYEAETGDTVPADARLVWCADATMARGTDPARVVVLPDGADLSRIAFAAPEERAALKQRMGVGDEAMAFFVGSGSDDNVVAVQGVFELAAALPHVAFAIAGAVCHRFDPTLKPANVLFLGEIDEVALLLCLQCCDVALHLPQGVGGSRAKVLQYLAAGIPVLATPQGVAGLGIEPVPCEVGEPEDLPEALARLLGEGAANAHARAAAARAALEAGHDWHDLVAREKPRLLRALAA